MPSRSRSSSTSALVLGVLSALTLGVWPPVWNLVVAHTEAEFAERALIGCVVELHLRVILVGALLAFWMFGLIGGVFAVPLLVVLRTVAAAWRTVPAAEALTTPLTEVPADAPPALV